MEEVWVRVHRHEGHVLVAACDAELLGMELKHRGVDIKISEKFYGGFKVSIEEALRLIEEATSANLLGERIVKAAIKRGLIHKDAVIKLAGNIPHAMMIKI